MVRDRRSSNTCQVEQVATLRLSVREKNPECIDPGLKFVLQRLRRIVALADIKRVRAASQTVINLLFVLQLLAQQPTCTDFSGNFVIQGEDGRVAVRIQQTGCSRITVSWESSLYPNNPPVVHSLTLGGMLQPDRAWFGQSGMQQTAASMLPNKLELFKSPLAPSRDSQKALMLRLDRLSDDDLCVADAKTNSVSPAIRASRQRAAGKEGEDEAALRSSGGCRVP